MRGIEFLGIGQRVGKHQPAFRIGVIDVDADAIIRRRMLSNAAQQPAQRSLDQHTDLLFDRPFGVCATWGKYTNWVTGGRCALSIVSVCYFTTKAYGKLWQLKPTTTHIDYPPGTAQTELRIGVHSKRW